MRQQFRLTTFGVAIVRDDTRRPSAGRGAASRARRPRHRPRPQRSPLHRHEARLLGRHRHVSRVVRRDSLRRNDSGRQRDSLARPRRVGAHRRVESRRSLQAEEYLDAARHPELPLRAGAVAVSRTAPRSDRRHHDARRHAIDHDRRSSPSWPRRPRLRNRLRGERYDFGVAGGTVMGRLIGRRVRVHVRAATGREAR